MQLDKSLSDMTQHTGDKRALYTKVLKQIKSLQWPSGFEVPTP